MTLYAWIYMRTDLSDEATRIIGAENDIEQYIAGVICIA